MNALINKIKDTVNAANILVQKKLYRESASELWKAVRSAIFYNLKKEVVPYSSTREALRNIIQLNDNLGDDIIFMEIIGTLSDWDQYFEISKEQIENFREKANYLIFKLTGLEIITTTNDYYFILEEEIKRHTEDVEYAKATQYAAAERNDRLYNILLFWGFIITLIGLSGLLFSISLWINFEYNWISHVITLIGACITLWPLIKDYSGKAMNHRRFAEEYNTIYKKCKNWKTDFSGDNNIFEAKKELHLIRNQVISTNSLSPKTVPKDYEVAKKNINSGSYTYNYLEQKMNNNKYNKLRNIIMNDNNIIEKENTLEALQLLKAQRVAYTKAKKYGYIDFIIALSAIAYFIIYILNKSMHEYVDIFTFVSLILSLSIIFLYKIQKNKTLIGANIQEKFDIEIFDLPQNKILTPVFPHQETIDKYASKYKKSDMKNWYEEKYIIGFPHQIAVLRCQYINLVWDQKQRKGFRAFTFIVLLLVILLYLFLCHINNFQEWIKMLIIISPAITYLAKNISGQKDMIEKEANVIHYVLDLLNKYKLKQSIPSESELRDIQNTIYNFRTQVSPMISDIWYRISKKNTENYLKQVFDNL
ncbi:MAG: SLATT domain-containing protein [Bacteroidales bacterium]|jgi:hypothetical protein|nr:SLATT domain-containing protein [Bacteroidales bacterium]